MSGWFLVALTIDYEFDPDHISFYSEYACDIAIAIIAVQPIMSVHVSADLCSSSTVTFTVAYSYGNSTHALCHSCTYTYSYY